MYLTLGGIFLFLIHQLIHQHELAFDVVSAFHLAKMDEEMTEESWREASKGRVSDSFCRVVENSFTAGVVERILFTATADDVLGLKVENGGDEKEREEEIDEKAPIAGGDGGEEENAVEEEKDGNEEEKDGSDHEMAVVRRREFEEKIDFAVAEQHMNDASLLPTTLLPMTRSSCPYERAIANGLLGRDISDCLIPLTKEFYGVEFLNDRTI